MIAELTRSYEIDAAHRLPSVPKGHKCSRMHGHGFRIEVTVRGEVGKRTGWVMDFAAVDRAVRPLVDSLDHRTLNDVRGLENPTSEVLAGWLCRDSRWRQPVGQSDAHTRLDHHRHAAPTFDYDAVGGRRHHLLPSGRRIGLRRTSTR